MIEKLKEHDIVDPKTGNVIGKIGCDLREIMDKLNEVIEAANKHEDIIRQIGEWGTSKGECLWCENLTAVNLDDRMIGCTTLDIPESYKTDPFARQRQWIGKLCWFWDEDRKDAFCEVLGYIDENSKYPYVIVDWNSGYKHCEPVKPDSDIIYKGE